MIGPVAAAAADLAPSVWPAAAVALPLLGVAVAVVGERHPGRWKAVSLVAIGAATLSATLAVVPAVLSGGTPQIALLRMTPQLWLALRVDALGATYAITVAGLGLLALVYSFGYLRPGPRRARYFAFLLACLGCTLGVAYAGNLLTLFVFYEAFSVLTYVLVVHEQTPEALAAGLKYIVYILVGGSLVLAGVLLTYALGGDLTFTAGGVLPAGAPEGQLWVAFWCLVVGFGVKAALVPLHGWVPDAHPAAPAPFSALLSGVMVAAGSFGIMRVLFDVYGVSLVRELGVAPWLAAIATATVLVGAILAIGQDDLKRRLAYSTISQMGYVTLAVALLGAGATTAALVHLVHHAFMKGTLFFCAGLWIRRTGSRRISELRGVGARMPLTSAAFALAALGMIGVPPLAGFASKWWLGLGMLEVDAPLAMVVLLVGALLAAAYLLPVVVTVVFAPADDGVASPRPTQAWRAEAPPALLIPTLVAAGLTLLFGLGAQLGGFPLQLARRAAAAWFGGA